MHSRYCYYLLNYFFRVKPTSMTCSLNVNSSISASRNHRGNSCLRVAAVNWRVHRAAQVTGVCSVCVCVCINSHQCVLCDERLTGRVCVAHAFHLEIQDLGRGNCKHSFYLPKLFDVSQATVPTNRSQRAARCCWCEPDDGWHTNRKCACCLVLQSASFHRAASLRQTVTCSVHRFINQTLIFRRHDSTCLFVTATWRPITHLEGRSFSK